MTLIDRIASKLLDLHAWMDRIEKGWEKESKDDKIPYPTISTWQFKDEIGSILKTIEQEETSVKLSGHTNVRLIKVARELSRGTYDYDTCGYEYTCDDAINYLIDRLEQHKDDSILTHKVVDFSTDFWKYHHPSEYCDKCVKNIDFELDYYKERLHDTFDYPPKEKERDNNE